jgi:hypothetical protein
MQFGGGNCSLCKSPGTNKSTCPLNTSAAKPNPTKHSFAAVPQRVLVPQRVQVNQIAGDADVVDHKYYSVYSDLIAAMGNQKVNRFNYNSDQLGRQEQMFNGTLGELFNVLDQMLLKKLSAADFGGDKDEFDEYKEEGYKTKGDILADGHTLIRGGRDAQGVLQFGWE